MSIKVKEGVYKCGYCGKIFEQGKVPDSPYLMANQCFESHELTYIPLSKADLKGLINFLYFKDDKFLTETLVNTLLKYNKLEGK